jgi:endonuclease/exonuclease/phosphatase family metal-dependent hydrolase
MRKQTISLAVLFALCWTPMLLGDQAPEELTIATWNLEWYFDSYKGDNSSDLAKEQSAPSREEYEWKRDRLAEAIAGFKPTILAVQEIENRRVLLDLTTALRDQHKLNYRVAFIEGFDFGTEQDVAFLFQSGLVEFSRKEQTREMFDSKEFYSLSKHIFAQFEWQADGKTEKLTILNAHFRAKAEEGAIRLKQAKLARRWVQTALDAGENVILLGDFNIEDPAGKATKESELAELLGNNTANTADDLFDVLVSVPEPERRTHLILDKQFDRILVSKSLVDDAPDKQDLVFENAAVLAKYTVRGKGPDLDHWDARYTTPQDERDLSDHYPLMATFRFK